MTICLCDELGIPDQVRERKRGYEVVNQITLEEARNSTPAQRMNRASIAINGFVSAGHLKRKPLIPDTLSIWKRLYDAVG